MKKFFSAGATFAIALMMVIAGYATSTVNPYYYEDTSITNPALRCKQVNSNTLCVPNKTIPCTTPSGYAIFQSRSSDEQQKCETPLFLDQAGF